ncbi:MAG: phosphoribosylanthranilate isomerase [Planctomycetota bacterium]
MFDIKICGVRLEKDLVAVEDSGADAVGLNFFPPSVRFVAPASDLAAALARSAQRRGLMTVGVFVNESLSRLREIAVRVGLDAIQLHGDEPVEVARELIDGGIRVVRAVKLPRGAFEPDSLERLSRPWREIGCHVLLDVDAGASHGGSGKTLDWDSVRRWAATSEGGWTLAGGLKPENLVEAIHLSGARSVDTASGVECPKGVKNEERIQAFVKAYRHAIVDGSQTSGRP